MIIILCHGVADSTNGVAYYVWCSLWTLGQICSDIEIRETSLEYSVGLWFGNKQVGHLTSLYVITEMMHTHTYIRYHYWRFGVQKQPASSANILSFCMWSISGLSMNWTKGHRWWVNELILKEYVRNKDLRKNSFGPQVFGVEDRFLSNRLEVLEYIHATLREFSLLELVFQLVSGTKAVIHNVKRRWERALTRCCNNLCESLSIQHSDEDVWL